MPVDTNEIGSNSEAARSARDARRTAMEDYGPRLEATMDLLSRTAANAMQRRAAAARLALQEEADAAAWEKEYSENPHNSVLQGGMTGGAIGAKFGGVGALYGAAAGAILGGAGAILKSDNKRKTADQLLNPFRAIRQKIRGEKSGDNPDDAVLGATKSTWGFLSGDTAGGEGNQEVAANRAINVASMAYSGYQGLNAGDANGWFTPDYSAGSGDMSLGNYGDQLSLSSEFNTPRYGGTYPEGGFQFEGDSYNLGQSPEELQYGADFVNKSWRFDPNE